MNGTDADEWRAALSRSANIVFLETPSNPMLDVVDLALVSELACAAGARVVVDNVFATPASSARWSSASMSWFIRPPSTSTARAAAWVEPSCATTNSPRRWRLPAPYRPRPHPFNAWLLLKGLETMDLRIAAQVQSAQQVADFLEGHGKIAKTLYPGLKSHPQYELAHAR